MPKLMQEYGLISFETNRKDFIEIKIDRSRSKWTECRQKILELIPTVIYCRLNFNSDKEEIENFKDQFIAYYKN
jgi:hypothetical protein